MRNLTKTVAAVTLLAPNGAYPLGIGDIELHSALNQNLKAEISLVVSQDENISDIRVNLASPAKFEEAGIPHTIFLSKIQFEPIVKPDGSVVIQLSSKEALREPFLDFLVEVSWAKGNLYREFTVLVDPPATYQQETVLVASNSEYAGQTADTGIPSPSVADQSIKNRFQTPGEYGPTVKNDTLWEIAEKNITDPGISVEQMVMAIYKANPHAFYQDNVNALMAGEKLQIPDNSTILKLSRKQAREEFSQQTNEWRGRVAPPVASETSVAEVEAPEQSSQLKLLAPAETEINQQDVVAAGETDADAKTEAKPVEETAETGGSGQDFQEIQARLDKLEQQLTAMQELLALKDQQLAALQTQNAGSDLQSDADRVATQVIAQQSLNKTVESAEMARTEEPLQQPVKPVQANLPRPSQGIDPYYLVVGSVGSTLMLVLGWLWWRERKLEEDATESMFASSSEIVLPETEEDLSIPVINDNSSYDVGTVGESSFLSEFIPDDFDALEGNQNEVDPISEADVYLAYGRYQQAEELIRQAIEDQPDRNECKLKLLEIYYAEENKNAFEGYVQELAESGKKEDTAFWSKVTEMGSDLSPESELFSADAFVDSQADNEMDGSGDDLQLAESAADLTETELLAQDLELNSFSSETEDLNEEQPETDQFSSLTLELEPDFSEIQKDSELETDSLETENLLSSKAEEIDKPVEENQELENSEFDFSSFTELDVEQKGDDVQETVDHEIVSLDFDFSDDLSDTKLEESLSEGSFDFNFDIDSAESDGGSMEYESQVADLTDMDEFETKIDLAKAYVDMGDAEAAKVIAEEVVEKGNDIQKKEAQAVLDRL